MKKKEINFEEKLKELETKKRTLEAVHDVYLDIQERMQWTAMDCHEPDDKHEEYWYTKPEPEDEYDGYNMARLAKYEIYQEVLDHLMDLV